MRRALIAFLLPVVATAWSCLGPTEIVVEITTNACKSLDHADIYVDGFQVGRASQFTCDPDNAFAVIDIGDITVLPSHGIDSKVDLTIVGAVGDKCETADTAEIHCIVARRTLSFIPHTRLDLPILLDSACAGLNCGPNQTCKVDSTGAHCGGSTCGDGADEVPCEADGGGGTSDGGGVTPDVVVADIVQPPICPIVFPPPSPQATFSWSFEKAGTVVNEDNFLVKPPPALAQTSKFSSTPPTFCDGYLLTEGPQTLVANDSKLQTASFSVGVAYVATKDGVILGLTTSAQSGGFDISVKQGLLVVDFDSPGMPNPIFSTPTVVADGHWHRFAMDVTTSFSLNEGGAGGTTTFRPYVEDVAGKLITLTAPYLAASTGLSTGPIDGVDDITFYAK